MKEERLQVEVPEAFVELYEPSRYKIFYGGRGAGKSWQFGRAAVILAYARKIRVLCVREIQKSISDSVHKLLQEQIYELGLDKFFKVTKDAIVGANGSEFIFKGLHNNTNEIKSTEGVDICWVEEGQSVTADSWDVLIPTIRKDGSEIWVTFNPLNESDATYQKFIVNPPYEALVKKVNYWDNPYFPEVLRKEMEWLKEKDYQAYLHIWEGECRKISKALVFGDRYRVEEFDTPDGVRFYHGADWGFACLVGDTEIPTETGIKLLRDIKVGDRVLTRDGYKRVLHAQSSGVKKVYEVECGYKNSIIATGDHRVFTNEGWKQVNELREAETLCMMKSSLTARFIRGILTANTRITITGSMEEKVRAKYFTGLYGNTITGKFLTAATSIMLMAIRSITTLTTLFASLKANIKKSIIGISLAVYQKSGLLKMDTQKKTGKHEGKRHWRPLRSAAACVWNVGNRLLSRMSTKNFVPRIAESTKTRGTAKENTPANVAVRFLQRLLTKLEKPALVNVPINLQSKGEAEVFDITVENGEYFANGVLVHNCDPTTLVRCFIINRTIYIDAEAWGVGVDLDETPAFFDIIPTARRWPIKADCARPETISFMKRRGFNITAAKKWQGSVEDGIEWLKSYDIVIHPRCKHTIDEFEHYSYKQDKVTGDILPVIVDAFNHIIDALRYSMDGLIKGKGMTINPKALQGG